MINILSLFDGISCGQVAINNIGIKYQNYFSSEIDKNSIIITQNNFPNTIQVGDVTLLKGCDLPKIDLLIGGSPCQGFSFAGKQLNFNDPRSKLFFEFVRIFNEVKPKYFLLENVKMKKQYMDIITSYLGVDPIEINSSLVSAQHRRRLYWTNIPNIKQPEDKNIVINDIIEDNIGGKKITFDENGIYRGIANNKKNIILESYIKPPYTIYETRTEEGKKQRRLFKELYGIDSTPRNVIHKEYRINKKNKCNCVLTSRSELDCIVDRQYNYRYLTVTEVERLQTLPDNYTNYINDRQRIKTLGNGWTVSVISHILKNIK